MFNFLVRNKIKNLCKNSSREKKFLNVNKIHSILILFETVDYEDVDACMIQLEKAFKNIKGYGYKVKDDKYDYSETSYRIIEHKVDTNALGVPTDALLDELSVQTYDVLIDFSVKENITLEYLVAASNISLKVGLKKNKLPIYDMSISKLPKKKDSSPCTELGRQIFHYLSTIQSE